MKSVYISIINFNGSKNTLDCLESVRNLKREGLKIAVFVIDNASKEKFILPKNYPKDIRLKLIENKENLGFSGAHNIIFNLAVKDSVDYVLVLNNDTVLQEKLLEELIGTNADITAPKIYFYPGFEFHKDRYKKEDKGRVFWYAGGVMDWKNVIGQHRGVDEVDKGQYGKISETDFSSGACMLVKREVFERVGLFDNKYFLYYEDNDLCMRAKKKGFIILYNPKAILWHKNAGSAGGSGSNLQDYYITRNRMLFGMKFAPFRSKLSLIRESLNLLFSGRAWQKKGILDFYFGRFGKGSYA